MLVSLKYYNQCVLVSLQYHYRCLLSLKYCILMCVCWSLQGLALLCETIEDCWDHESEARLSAGCVEERVGQMRRAAASGGLEDILPMVAMVTNLDPAPKESSI